MSVKSLYPMICKKSANDNAVTVAGAGDDRISLLTAENADWSRIVKNVDVETDKYFGFSVGSLPENASSAAWLKIGTDVIATNGIQAMTISAGVSLVILQNQSYNDYHEAVSDVDGYYFYLIGDDDAVLTYLQSVQSENPDYLRWYADDGNGGLGTLIFVGALFYWAESGGYLVSQFYEIEYQEEGWYRNLTTFFNAGSLIPNTYLENITFRADGIAYNGAAAWTGETSAFNREASLSENEKVIIYNGKYWSNSEYINDATDGFYDENGSCILVWFNPCDFYLENRNAGEITRYELHAPLTINDDENITRVQYSNKGYLLGLPASDATDTLHSDTHIVGTISIYGTVNNVTTYTAIFDYPVGKSYMQAVLTLASGYLYIRIADNAICNGSNGAFSVSAGNSAIVAFLHETDDFSDDSIDIATCKSFDALKDKMSVIINIPSFANQTYIETDKNPVAADLLTGKEAWANGVKIVGEGSGGGGDDYSYKRVSGVPDGAALLAAATNITVGEVEYMPIYILINYADTLSDTYTKTGTGVSTGADAYLFSDAPTTLEVGTSVTHTWDLDKDIATVEGWKCRWVMAYAVKTGYVRTTISIHLLISFELIGGTNLIAYGVISGGSSGTSANYYLRFIDLSASSYYNNNVSVAYAFSYLYAVQELILPESTTTLSARASIQECRVLSKLTASGLTIISNNYCVYLCPVLTFINLPELTTVSGTDCFAANGSIKKIDLLKLTTVSAVSCFQSANSLEEFNAPLLATVNAAGFCGLNYALKYIDLSNILTLTGSTSSTLNYCKYVKLANGFNISGWDFSGAVTKSIQWFYDLAEWLYDRSGDTAGSLVLGANNIAILNSLYLEDGTTPLTSIFDAKNWTRS